ncbi:MAG: zinc-ribbon domain-containing protein [Deltaproteobacteria bacterium]|nr:zinc-ribbon domain-containing protein [Deltaproteobacteria bacterium]MBW2589167.1 zinc-ribbon domain-containing protein [Deltaproteobacteria bacterium]
MRSSLMDIICEKCQSKFAIPDEKIPDGKVISTPCPKCKNVLYIDSAKKQGVSAGEEFYTDTSDNAEKPFDFIEEEGSTALVCEQNPDIRKKVIDALDIMEYHITVAESGRDALKKMRYHVYDLIVINETFNSDSPDSNMVMLYLERLPMSIRRNTFVIMISTRFHTMDRMLAFRYSVHIILNSKNIDDFAKIVSRGLTDNELFYQVFKESLKTIKRI